MNTNNLHFTASNRPREVIEAIPRRPSQPPSMRQYADGFDEYFNLLPVLRTDDPLLGVKVRESELIMKELAAAIIKDNPALNVAPAPGKFSRVILAVEEPKDAHEGSEILIAQWGEGFSSPVHGHSPGLLHEEILSGKMLVHTYRHAAPGIVRPVRSDLAGVGTLVSKFSPPDPRGTRMGLVHNFVALEPSVSLHFVPEHTRDGRDNKFTVEHFTAVDAGSVQQLNGDQGRRLQIGEVALVRSANVPDYGDHFIVIVGPLMLKPHGLRPMDVAIQAGADASALLDQFKPVGQTGLTLLKLDEAATKRFHAFHGITTNQNTITFPEL